MITEEQNKECTLDNLKKTFLAIKHINNMNHMQNCLKKPKSTVYSLLEKIISNEKILICIVAVPTVLTYLILKKLDILYPILLPLIKYWDLTRVIVFLLKTVVPFCMYKTLILKVTSNWLKDTYDSNLEKNKSDIEKLRRATEKLVEIVNENSILPPKYQNTYSISKMLEYINNKRADNLKEAINLFELEQQHNQRISELQNLQYDIQEIHSHLDTIEVLEWANLLDKSNIYI